MKKSQYSVFVIAFAVILIFLALHFIFAHLRSTGFDIASDDGGSASGSGGSGTASGSGNDGGGDVNDEQKEKICDDKKDNDGDELIDCDDEDCWGEKCDKEDSSKICRKYSGCSAPAKCDDSDALMGENQIFSKGTIFLDGKEDFEDKCQGFDKLTKELLEGVCLDPKDGDYMQEFETCPDGYICDGGKCVEGELGECTETDDGKDIFTKGKLKIGSETIGEDRCPEYSWDSVYEYFCDETKPDKYDAKYIKCLENGHCFEGACVKDYCFDTDPSDSKYVKGEVYIKGEKVAIDDCDHSGKKTVEYYCNSKESSRGYTSKYVSCEPGEACSEGVCYSNAQTQADEYCSDWKRECSDCFPAGKFEIFYIINEKGKIPVEAWSHVCRDGGCVKRESIIPDRDITKFREICRWSLGDLWCKNGAIKHCTGPCAGLGTMCYHDKCKTTEEVRKLPCESLASRWQPCWSNCVRGNPSDPCIERMVKDPEGAKCPQGTCDADGRCIGNLACENKGDCYKGGKLFCLSEDYVGRQECVQGKCETKKTSNCGGDKFCQDTNTGVTCKSKVQTSILSRIYNSVKRRI